MSQTPPGPLQQELGWWPPPPPTPVAAPPAAWYQPPPYPPPVSGGRRRPAVLIVALCVVMLAVGVAIGGLTANRRTSAPFPAVASLKVLGGPAEADGYLVVINVTAGKAPQLTGIDAADDQVVWQRPYSTSGIPPGIFISPEVVGHEAIDLEPMDGSGSAVVKVAAVNVATGAVEWTYGTEGVVGDDPNTCADNNYLCISWTTQTQDGLLELDSRGRLVRLVPGVAQIIATDLYQTVADNATLVQLSARGLRRWVRSTSSIFGSYDNNPDYGWDVDTYGKLDVGSLGAAPDGNRVDLGSYTTTGFSVATGRTVWTDRGQYDCGALGFLTQPVICRFTGSTDGNSTAGVGLTLEGFDPSTGAITWRQPVADVATYAGYSSAPVPVLDGSHIVVRTPGGRLRLLDTANGHETAAGTGQSYWCPSFPNVGVTTPTGSGYGDSLSGSPRFATCDAAGATVSRLPGTEPDVIGVTVGSRFYWLSPHGLRWAPTPLSTA